MNIVFIGTVDMSHAILEKLIQIGADISGVVTQKNPGPNSDHRDLVPLCQSNAIPWIHADQVPEKDLIDWITRLAPDMVFCFGWSFLLKQEIIDLPPQGILGFHPALLPRNRGRHPLIWTLALGCENAGSSFFFIDQGIDSGDIISQKKIPVAYGDTAKTLYKKIKVAALSQVGEFFPMLENNSFQRIVQDHTNATYWRKRSQQDGEIDFRMSSKAVYNLVRALTKPYPGAHLCFKGNQIKIWEVMEIQNGDSDIEAGKILKVSDEGIDVKCYTDAVRIIVHEFSDLPKPGEYL